MTTEHHLWQLTDRLLDLSRRPLIMGIVNITPDSFSDGGQHFQTDQAISHAHKLIEDGADILDIGGESTRPGSMSVSTEEEWQRVGPVLSALVKQTSVPLSIDTSKAEIARRSVDLGVPIINDVTALTGDPDMPKVAMDARAAVVLMHMLGQPRTMQQAPQYTDVVQDIRTYLQHRLDQLQQSGLDLSRTVIDPGIGFGKTFEHNLELLARLPEFATLGRPLCLGVSRKSFLGTITGRAAEERINGSVAVACYAMTMRSAHILRVHDVKETYDAVRVLQAIMGVEKTRV